MRAAAAFRRGIRPDEISAETSRAESLRFCAEGGEGVLPEVGGAADEHVGPELCDLSAKMEEYVEGLFDSIKKTSKYSDLTVWLDDYANKLAGKQLFSDRDMEREVGRTSLERRPEAEQDVCAGQCGRQPPLR